MARMAMVLFKNNFKFIRRDRLVVRTLRCGKTIIP